MKKPIMKTCLIVGTFSLGIGVAGFVYTFIPPGPFLFIAIILFMHCTPCFISWFKKIPIHSCYIDDFIRERSMTRRNKIKTLLVGTILAIAAFFAFKPLWAKIMVVILVIAKYYYVIFCVWIKISDGDGVPRNIEDKERDSD